MFIFNVYKNLFENCNSFPLLQKMLDFYGILMVILPQSYVVSYFQNENYVWLFLKCPLSSLKSLMGFRF